MQRLFSNPLFMVWFETFLRFGTALVILPIALLKLHDVELSLWLLFNAMMAIALLADSGFSPTILRATAYFYTGAVQIPKSFISEEKIDDIGEPNWERINALIATTRRLYVLLGFVSLILIGGLGTVSVWNLMSMSGHNIRFWTAFAVLVGWACVQVQIVRWSGIMQGLGKVAKAKQIDSGISMAKIIAFSAVLLLDTGILGITIAGLVIASINHVVMRSAVLRSVPIVADARSKFDALLSRRIWPATWRLGIMNWGTYMIYYGSALVTAQLSDVKLIASYLLNLRIISLRMRLSMVQIVNLFTL